eukprot:362607-Chlamydomonas_euryale.AAC.1
MDGVVGCPRTGRQGPRLSRRVVERLGEPLSGRPGESGGGLDEWPLTSRLGCVEDPYVLESVSSRRYLFAGFHTLAGLNWVRLGSGTTVR